MVFAFDCCLRNIPGFRLCWPFYLIEILASAEIVQRFNFCTSFQVAVIPRGSRVRAIRWFSNMTLQFLRIASSLLPFHRLHSKDDFSCLSRWCASETESISVVSISETNPVHVHCNRESCRANEIPVKSIWMQCKVIGVSHRQKRLGRDVRKSEQIGVNWLWHKRRIGCEVNDYVDRYFVCDQPIDKLSQDLVHPGLTHVKNHIPISLWYCSRFSCSELHTVIDSGWEGWSSSNRSVCLFSWFSGSSNQDNLSISPRTELPLLLHRIILSRESLWQISSALSPANRCQVCHPIDKDDSPSCSHSWRCLGNNAIKLSTLIRGLEPIILFGESSPSLTLLVMYLRFSAAPKA